jgi:hypothetical protein
MGIELALAGGTLLGGLYSSRQQSKAADRAAGLQSDAALAGIGEQQRQFDAIQQLLSPFVKTGTEAQVGQRNLIGLGGADAQAAAIQALQNSPEFAALQQQGESRILANASATGGLRGGNTQGALAQFAPALLSAQINDQYNRLGGLASMGLGAATQTGSFGQAATNNVTQLLQQQGSALAGGALAQGKAQAGYANAITGAMGQFLGGFGGLGGGGGGSPYGYIMGGGF